MPRSAEIAWFLAIDRQDVPPKESVLTIAGRLGTATVPEFEDAVGRAIEAGNYLIRLDLTAVDYINSAGLAAIGRAADHLCRRGGSLTLVGVHGPVELALQLAGPIAHATVESSGRTA